MKYKFTLLMLPLVINTVIASPPLKITAQCIHATSYQVQITNVSTNDVVFRIGTNVGNGRYLFYDAITLVLYNSKGTELRVVNNRDNLGMIGGRMDPLFIALTPGASLTIPLDASSWRFDSIKTDQISTYKLSLTSRTHGPFFKPPIQYDNRCVLNGTYESPKYTICSTNRANTKQRLKK